MCGIVGFTGNSQAAPILLDGLSKLEYRGYDSAGMAVRDGENQVSVVKAKGRLRILAEKTADGESVPGTCGIGHTRWATHGEPSENNAHPHISNEAMDVVAVHNGIIENYQEIRNKLLKHGYEFYSETDTEAAVKLIDYYYKKYNMGPIDALAKTMVRIRGSYALAVMFRDYPGEIYVARKDSPMIIGVSDGSNGEAAGTYVASDVPAILKYTRNVYYIGNLEMGRLTKDGVIFYNLDGDQIEKEKTEIKWDAEAAEKGGFEHFMMKEIHEQPRAITDTINAFVRDGKIDLSEVGLDDEKIKSLSQVYIVACGSASHVGVTTQYVMEEAARIPVHVDLASEFRYRKPVLDKDTLVIIISQSGETADSLAALREAKRKGARILSVVNVVGSSVARESDDVFYTWAGPEIAVASTKAYTTQLICMYLIGLYMGSTKGTIEKDYYTQVLEELKLLPKKVEKLFGEEDQIAALARKYHRKDQVFYVGRGLDSGVSYEGSLKLKEISYINSFAIAAGELKHGTIALMEEETLVFALATQDFLYEKMVSNVEEIKARGARVVAIAKEGRTEIEQVADEVIYIPPCMDEVSPVLAVIPLQIFAYYVAKERGCNIDKPKNLAKSVTVE